VRAAAKAESSETASNTIVIPAKAGIHFTQPNMDSRFRGNDGLIDLRVSQSITVELN
jgi:hypothetical protein